MAGYGGAGRLFVGVPLPTAVAGSLDAHLTRHAVKLGGLPGRVVPAANRHVTLLFLGDLDEPGAARVRTALAEADLGGAFQARVGSLGAFPHAAQARVLWVGFSTGQEAFAELARRVGGAADASLRDSGAAQGAAAGVSPSRGTDGPPARAKPFSAHITLSRLRTAANLNGLLGAVPALDEQFSVTEVVLFRSVLGHGPPVYERVATYPLLPRASV